jgi:hypothetical protein
MKEICNGEYVISGIYGYGVVLDINTSNEINTYKVSFDRYGVKWVCSLVPVCADVFDS